MSVAMALGVGILIGLIVGAGAAVVWAWLAMREGK